MLRAYKANIVNEKGETICLQGVNLGGWLMMEAYILHAPNYAERLFKKKFASRNGSAALRDFENNFRNNFIKEDDFKRIAGLNLNCLRLPFNYRLIEKKPFQYDVQGVKYLDKAIAWAKKNNLYVILDLHAAVGAQNHDWHSDSLGQALLWKNKNFQKRSLALWEFLADRYKDNETIAGYDLLNEAVLSDTPLLNNFYKQLIRTIRGVDKRHILFVEGSHWAMDLACLEDFDDDNIVLSVHNYQPLEFTFNLTPHLKYPLKGKEFFYNKNKIRQLLAGYKKISLQRNRPIFVGEFGVNDRQGLYQEDVWLKDTLSCYKEFGFHWAYWTYKAVKNNLFPDGLYSYYPNPPWVNRAGPKQGWDTYADCWPKFRKAMIASWGTENFKENTKITKVLKNAAN